MHQNYISFFHSEGNVPLSRQDLKISSAGGKTESPKNLIIRILIISCPWALFGSMIFINLATSALVTEIEKIILVVFILSIVGISLAFSIRIHPLAKKLLNDLTLSLQLEMKL